MRGETVVLTVVLIEEPNLPEVNTLIRQLPDFVEIITFNTIYNLPYCSILIYLTMKIKNPISKIVLFAVAIIYLASCSQASGNRESTKSKDISSGYNEAANAPVPNQTNVQQMLRTAMLKFRVTDVQKSTNQIEKMARFHGGYVAQSMFNIEETESLIKKRNTDSAEEIKKLIPRNHIEVFVLNSKLDTFLEKVEKMVDHLEYRHLTAFDKQIETTTAEAPTKTEDGNANNYQVYDRSAGINTKYARVTMDIYQTPVVKKWIIPNPDSFEVARGGFWEDFVSSIKSGGRGIGMAFNFIVALWPIWIFGLLIYFIIKKRKTLFPFAKKSKKD